MNLHARFIDDPPRSAAFNMAADLYLLARASESTAVTVRVYRWQSPTVSIGYMQRPSELLDMESLARHGAEWIRRPTGGRAILHHRDITYSCVFSRSLAPMGSTLAETYRLISRCLIEGLALAGIPCEPHDSSLDSRGARARIKLPCFLAPNREEIMAGGRKLVGSAQKRSARAVLQHGSIPLTCAFRQLPHHERVDVAERARLVKLLREKCACVAELLPGFLESDLVGCIKEGFAKVLPLPLRGQNWTDDEYRQVSKEAQSSEFQQRWTADDG